MPTEQTWQNWLERLYNLRRAKRGTYQRPHKPALLLAILDILEGQRDRIALANRPVIEPGEKKFYPAIESLRWREKHLCADC